MHREGDLYVRYSYGAWASHSMTTSRQSARQVPVRGRHGRRGIPQLALVVGVGHDKGRPGYVRRKG